MGELFSNFFADFISSDVHFFEDLSTVAWDYLNIKKIW